MKQLRSLQTTMTKQFSISDFYAFVIDQLNELFLKKRIDHRNTLTKSKDLSLYISEND